MVRGQGGRRAGERGSRGQGRGSAGAGLQCSRKARPGTASVSMPPTPTWTGQQEAPGTLGQHSFRGEEEHRRAA